MASRWTSIEVGLVLQGGGALGAYEWGAIEGLFSVMDRLDREGRSVRLKAVSGVSIGAINGACVVGAEGKSEKSRRDKARDQLAGLWGDLALETPFRIRVPLPFNLPAFAPGRDLSLFGLPGFYTPRPDIWRFASWTNFYDTSELKKTLPKYVCFKEIDRSPMTFVVTAVDVLDGTLKRFRNKAANPAHDADKTPKQRQEEDKDHVEAFGPEHILASGSLPPQFPWTEVDERKYWDGGIVDNTPLGDVLEAFSPDGSVYRLLVVMNLYPLVAPEPKNLLDVSDRLHELSYGNRVRQDRDSAKQVNKLVRAVEALKGALDQAHVPLAPEAEKSVAAVGKLKIAKVVDVDFQNRAGQREAGYDDADGLRDFSPETIARRRSRGCRRAIASVLRALRDDKLTGTAAGRVPAMAEA